MNNLQKQYLRVLLSRISELRKSLEEGKNIKANNLICIIQGYIEGGIESRVEEKTPEK